MEYLLGIIFASVLCGSICKAIATSRGMEGGFWWGFFLWVIGIIIVAVRPYENNTPHIYYCGKCDKAFIGTEKNSKQCPKCGKSLLETVIFSDEWSNASNEKRASLKEAFAKGEFLKESAISSRNRLSEENSVDEIRKYKELLDDGIITQEEFNSKKKQLLGL